MPQSSTSVTLGTSYDNNTEINELKATITKNTNKNNSNKKKVFLKDDESKNDSFASAISGTITVNQETSTIASDNDLLSNYSFVNNEKPVGGVALERKPLKYFKPKENQDVHSNKTEWHVRQRRVKVKNKAVAAVESASINTCNVSTATKSKPVKDFPNISDDSDSVKDIDERISTHSTDAMCRICHGGEVLSTELGELISACSCRGSVGRVHVRCLERWLTESCKSRCELCGTRYSTRRVHKYGVPKALVMWILSQNAKQLMVDSLGIMLMSPLAVLAAWLSGRTLAGLMMQEPQVTPWPLASTFVLACMTLVCYYCWIVSAATRHALGWWVWYRSQYEVRLQFALTD